MSGLKRPTKSAHVIKREPVEEWHNFRGDRRSGSKGSIERQGSESNLAKKIADTCVPCLRRQSLADGGWRSGDRKSYPPSLIERGRQHWRHWQGTLPGKGGKGFEPLLVGWTRQGASLFVGFGDDDLADHTQERHDGFGGCLGLPAGAVGIGAAPNAGDNTDGQALH